MAPQESWVQRNEVPRKVLHGGIGLITTGLYVAGVQINQVTPVLIAMVIPIASIEVVRLTSSATNKLYIKVVGPLMRESEKNGQINGVIWYLVGLIFVFMYFPKDICLLSVYLLSWADLSASTAGRKWGKYTPKLVGNKSLAGSIAAFASGVVSAWCTYKYLLPAFPQYNPPGSLMWTPESSNLGLGGLSIITGLIGAVAELFPIIDDNLSIPVVGALGLYGVIRLYQK